jgi:hypothetical protein
MAAGDDLLGPASQPFRSCCWSTSLPHGIFGNPLFGATSNHSQVCYHKRAMTNGKVKFKISIKELSVEFEGDIQTAERIQQQVTGAINSLATAPNRLISGGQQQSVTDAIDVSPVRRRRRRRSKAADIGGDEGSPIELGAADAGEDVSTRKSNRRGEGQTSLITSLVNGGFFATRKTAGEIRDQLSKKGHSFKSNEISPTLGRLTREGILQRDRNNDNQWVYFTGS